jgi:hypothetical protein
MAKCDDDRSSANIAQDAFHFVWQGLLTVRRFVNQYAEDEDYPGSPSSPAAYELLSMKPKAQR